MMKRGTRFNKNLIHRGTIIVITCLLVAGILPFTSQAVGGSFEPGSNPSALVYGPQDSFWFSLLGTNQLVKLEGSSLGMPPQAIDLHRLPTREAHPFDLTIGPDQMLWFTGQKANQVGRFDLVGNFEEFPLPNPSSYPARITLGQDGSLWFTEMEGNRIGRLFPNGDLSEYELPLPDSTPLGITTAIDGSIWFTERNARQLGRLTPDGDLHEFSSPDPFGRPTVITVGPDGKLWFIYEIGKLIVSIDPVNHQMDSFSLPTLSTSLLDIVTGPDGRLWFLGVQTVGSVALTPAGPVDLVEEDLAKNVFEGEGNSRIISGPGTEMVYLTSNSQQVYTATVTAGSTWRDLQIFINHLPPLLLSSGEFHLKAEIRNWSSSPAAGTQVTLPLDNGIHFVDFETPVVGATCASGSDQVVCNLGEISAIGRIPITYTLSTDRLNTLPVVRQIELQVSNAASDYLPSNNRTFRQITIQNSIEYFNDFSNGSDDLWSHSDIGQPFDGLEYLGPFGNQRVTLTFRDLPPHDTIWTCFDLYVLGEWDGNTSVEPGSGNFPPDLVGPDLWSYYRDETRDLVTTFSNQQNLSQAYPHNYKEGNNPAWSGVAERGDFDTLPSILDSRYHFCRINTHHDTTFGSSFYGLNLKVPGESWALDNVSVKIYYDRAFDQIFFPMVIR